MYDAMGCVAKMPMAQMSVAEESTTLELIQKRIHWGKIIGWGGLFLATGGFLVSGVAYWNDWSNSRQMQEDPRVARVWLNGVTIGKTHELTQGTELQRWLNQANIHLLGDYSVLKSRFVSDPGGVELWFGYQSHVPKHPDLICHRVETTAFTDDLGQTYHGFLDVHGSVIGVYLSGYDHSAHSLSCNLHWMTTDDSPLNSPHARLVSKPMKFHVELPRIKRILPPLKEESLRKSATGCSAKKSGVTVEISDVQLSAPKLRNLYEGQRDLLFRLKISGGAIANNNLVEFKASVFKNSLSLSALKLQFRGNTRSLNQRIETLIQQNLRAEHPETTRLQLSPHTTLLSWQRIGKPLTITDPYGVSLIVPDETLSPQTAMESQSVIAEKGTVWVAPVNGGGRGTDSVRIHLDIRPYDKGGKSVELKPTIPFDLIVPVQTGDEI